MGADLTDADLELLPDFKDVIERHYECDDGEQGPHCGACSFCLVDSPQELVVPWPCDAARLLAKLAQARRRLLEHKADYLRERGIGGEVMPPETPYCRPVDPFDESKGFECGASTLQSENAALREQLAEAQARAAALEGALREAGKALHAIGDEGHAADVGPLHKSESCDTCIANDAAEVADAALSGSSDYVAVPRETLRALDEALKEEK